MQHADRRHHIAHDLFASGRVLGWTLLSTTLAGTVLFFAILPFAVGSKGYAKHAAYAALALLFISAMVADGYVAVAAFWRLQTAAFRRLAAYALVGALLQAAYWHALFRSKHGVHIAAVGLTVGILCLGLVVGIGFATWRRTRALPPAPPTPADD